MTTTDAPTEGGILVLRASGRDLVFHPSCWTVEAEDETLTLKHLDGTVFRFRWDQIEPRFL